MLNVTVVDEEIATPAADEADIPIGRLTLSPARFYVGRGAVRVVELPTRLSFAADACRSIFAPGIPRTVEELGGNPVRGTPARIVTGRVLRDACARTPRSPTALPFGVPLPRRARHPLHGPQSGRLQPVGCAVERTLGPRQSHVIHLDIPGAGWCTDSYGG